MGIFKLDGIDDVPLIQECFPSSAVCFEAICFVYQ